MHLSLRLWKWALARVGVKTRAARIQRARASIRHRTLRVESLEPLTMLTSVTGSAEQPSYIEGESAYFTFQLSEPAPQPFSITFELSGGPGGPSSQTLHFSQNATGSNLPFTTDDNSTPDDGYELSLQITSNESDPGGPFDNASTLILDDDGGGGGPGGGEELIVGLVPGGAHFLEGQSSGYLFFRSLTAGWDDAAVRH